MFHQIMDFISIVHPINFLITIVNLDVFDKGNSDKLSFHVLVNLKIS